jgi:regulatory protein
MGELRYFPGSEPRGAGSGDPAPDGGADWRVPVIGSADDGDASGEAESRAQHPAGDRAARTAERVSLGALARHDVSEAELRQKLAARGLEQEDVDAEVERLTRTGLLDDAALAERLVRNLRERKGLADTAIRHALRARRLEPVVVEAALAEEAEDDEATEARLGDLARDRASRLASLPPEVAERRLTGYLQRKGYSGSAVRVAVEAALADAWRHADR